MTALEAAQAVDPSGRGGASGAREPGCVVGVDVGGTKIMAARVGIDGTPSGAIHAPTPPVAAGAAALERAVVEAVRAAAAGHEVSAVGLAAAAFVDVPRERAMFAPHLAWRGEPVRERLEGALGVPVLLENDATCAAWAESRLGAGAEARSLVMVTVGTGIGGGLVIAGHLVRGANGMAGEYGHMVVVPNGDSCPCGARGCWERYCSGPALIRAAGDGFGTGAEITAAALAGDLRALRAFDEVGGWLGRGLGGLVQAIDPDVVVVGGGVSAAGELLLAPARAALGDAAVGAAARRLPDLRIAGLGPAAGMIGAALLVRSEILSTERQRR